MLNININTQFFNALKVFFFFSFFENMIVILIPSKQKLGGWKLSILASYQGHSSLSTINNGEIWNSQWCLNHKFLISILLWRCKPLGKEQKLSTIHAVLEKQFSTLKSIFNKFLIEKYFFKIYSKNILFFL